MSNRTAHSRGTSGLLFGEAPADRRSDSSFEEDRDRVVVPQQQAMGAGLRLVERHVVQRHFHTKFVGESAEEVRRLLAAKSRTPTNLHGHSIPARGRGR